MDEEPASRQMARPEQPPQMIHREQPPASPVISVMSVEAEGSGRWHNQPQLQQPSPSYVHSDARTEALHNSLTDFMGEIKRQFFSLKQQQAVTINSINSLTNDITSLNKEMNALKAKKNTKTDQDSKESSGKSKNSAKKANSKTPKKRDRR